MTNKFTWNLIVTDSGMIEAIYVPCDLCKHVRENDTCKAFPDGIPEDILTGEHDHTEPYPGDNGIQFEPIEEKEI